MKDGISDYQDFFPITLQKGKNVLLVRHVYKNYREISFFAGFAPNTEYALPKPVDIPDPNLRAVIAEALGKAPGAPITAVEMATLENLRAEDKNISDLTGLAFAKKFNSITYRLQSFIRPFVSCIVDKIA